MNFNVQEHYSFCTPPAPLLKSGTDLGLVIGNQGLVFIPNKLFPIISGNPRKQVELVNSIKGGCHSFPSFFLIPGENYSQDN